MTVVIGGDPSLASFGVVGPKADQSQILKPGSRKDPMRMIDLRDQFVAYCRAPIEKGLAVDELDLLVILEGFSFGSTTHAIGLGGIGWMVRAGLWEAGIPYLDVSPSTIKKYATGKGNARKDLVISAVAARTGIPFGTSDQVDAFVAWCIGRELTGQMHPMGQVPKTHRAALSGIKVGQAVGWGRRKDSAP